FSDALNRPSPLPATIATMSLHPLEGRKCGPKFIAHGKCVRLWGALFRDSRICLGGNEKIIQKEEIHPE
ncbi:hypothetical protein, partial [Pseudomonas sp. 57B-090624]|uniref:hypothetical protein n=1 Tax=Pseudomonas sp. 57B-090624 TaxID=2213080 RepID=UPI001C48FA58